MTSTENLRALRRTDPASDLVDASLDQRASDDLARITLNAPTEHRSRRRVSRRTVLVGVAAAPAGAIGLAITDPFGTTPPALAATPPLIDNVLGNGQPART